MIGCRRAFAGLVLVALALAVAGMQFVGQVQGTSKHAGIAKNQGQENAINDMLDQAAALGATHVVLTSGQRPRYWSFGQTVRREAFRKL